MKALSTSTKEALMVLAGAAIVGLSGWPGQRETKEAAGHEQRLATMRQEAARWVSATRQQEAEKNRLQSLLPRPAPTKDVAGHSEALAAPERELEAGQALESIGHLPVSAGPGSLLQEPQRPAQEAL